MSIENTNKNPISLLTNGQIIAINDLKSLFEDDNDELERSRRFQTNQSKQSLNIINNSFKDRTDISYKISSQNESHTDIIIRESLEQKQKNFELILECYSMLKNNIYKSFNIEDLNSQSQCYIKQFILNVPKYILFNDNKKQIRSLKLILDDLKSFNEVNTKDTKIVSAIKMAYIMIVNILEKVYKIK